MPIFLYQKNVLYLTHRYSLENVGWFSKMSSASSVSIIVVSDAVYEGLREDKSGVIAEKILKEKVYAIEGKRIVPNNVHMIIEAVLDAVKSSDAVIVIGGTGPSPRDQSVDAVEKIAWRVLPGFGELFRLKTYESKGIISVYTRAELFVVNKAPVAVVPGSTGAVELGVDLLVQALPHVIEELRRKKGEEHRRPV
jgi:molybdenum cofactor biosynthesis protein B